MPTCSEDHLNYLLQQHYEAECEVAGSDADPSLPPIAIRRSEPDAQGFNWDVSGKGRLTESVRAIAEVRAANWQLD